MTNLTTTSNIFKKVAWVIPFALAAIILIIVAIIRLSPKTTPPPQVPIPKISSPAQLQSTFDLSQLPPTSGPKELPLYTVSQGSDLRENAQSYAAKLGFTDSPQPTQDVDFGAGVAYLNKYGSLNIFEQALTYAGSTKSKTENRFSQDELKNKASQSLETLGFNQSLQNSKVTYFKTGDHEHIRVDDPSQADYVNFAFTPALDSFPVITSTSKNSISMNFFGDILQLSLRDFAQQAQKQNPYPILSFDEAKNKLVSNQATIISFSSPDYAFYTSLNVTIKNAYLAYYLQTQQQSDILHPVWIFEGDSTDGNVNTEVTYAVPAIAENYLIAPEL